MGYLDDYIKRNNLNVPGTSYTDTETTSNSSGDMLEELAASVNKRYDTTIAPELNVLGDLRKYEDLGLSPGTELVKAKQEGKLDSILSDSQSNWSKAMNAIGQTLVSEVALGTAKGLSDLIDFVGQKIFSVSDPDYSNPVSKFLEEKQEEFKNWAPVYSDPEKNILNGGLLDFGWWASNIPSIASSLTLLIPSTGVTKAISAIGKASKISKFTNRAARSIANPVARAFGGNGFTSNQVGIAFETGLNAALSRTMENYQEARQTYNDTYADAASSLKEMSDDEYANFLQRNSEYLENKDIDVTNKDEVAKQIAKSAADRTFRLDLVNTIFDAYQIYGLRNILTHAPKFNTNAAVRRAQRETMRTAGMDAEKAAAELAKDTKWTKAKNWIGDRLIGGIRQIKSELSEGVEEAINYIAQQEGTHLGKYIVSGEDGNPDDLSLLSSIGPMTRRIMTDYVNDSALWDSAFWGVLGGVVFQAGGNRLNRLSQTIKNRQEEKKSVNKDNEETKEAKLTPHWWMLDQSSETERMLASINGRNLKLNTLRKQMQKINSGKNPYITNEDSSNPDISSPVEERMLREKAYTEYLDELIIDARNNGTLKMLESYLEDSNVRSAIVDAYKADDGSNRVSNQEAEEAANKASERIKKIDRLYQDEIIHASDIADKVGDREGTSLPAEYIQMIASSNVRHRLNIERYDEVAALYNEDTERIKNVLGDKFESTIDYKGLVDLRATIQELSSLVAEKKELEEQQKEKPTISRQFDIDEINTQINLIKRKALQTATDAQLAQTLYALQVANSAVREYSPDRKSFKVNASDAELIENMDKFLTEDLGHIFEETDQVKRTNVSPEAVIGSLRKIMHDMRYVLPVDSEGNRQDTNLYLSNLDPKLPDNYDILARIELEKIKENAKLAETEQEIRHYIGAINNVQNIARKKAIEDAFNTLFEVQKNHTDINLLNISDTVYDNREADWLIDTNGLSDEERTSVEKALKVLNLTDIKNTELMGRLVKTLVHATATQKQVDANNKQNTEHAEAKSAKTTITETQNSSASQDSNAEQKNGQLNNISGQQVTQEKKQANGQIEQNNVPKAITLGTINNKEVASPATDKTNSTLSIPVVDLGNGNYELDFVTKGNDVHIPDISNSRLFDVRQQPMDGGIVKRNPIVRFGENNEVQVIAQGIVESPDISSEDTRNTEEQVVSETPKPISSTGELKPTVAPVANTTTTNVTIPTAQGGTREVPGTTVNKSDIKVGDTIGYSGPETSSVINYGKVEAIQGNDIVINGSVLPDGRTYYRLDIPYSEPERPIRGADPAEYIPNVISVAREYAIKLKNGETATYDDYIASLSEIKKEINDDAAFEKLAKEHWNRQMQRLATRYPEVVDNILNVLQSSTTEETPSSNLKKKFDTTFTKAVESLVKAYLKDIGQKKVNGKYVISLENLLRYCNGEFQNNENAEILYNVLASYLKSDEAKNLYDVIEEDYEINSNDFLDKVKTPLEERIDKSIKEENHRINTINIKDKTIFDELEEGQELTTTEDRDRIYFYFNGKGVGYIGKPRVVNGTYSSPYEYWLFSIRPNGKDTYYSRLADVFKSIVNAKDGDLREIYEAALSGSWNLKSNKTWQAIKNEYAINTIDKDTGEEYDDVDFRLLKVIRTMASFAVKYGSADKAIDGWFNALAQEYIAAHELSQNKNAKVVVDTITDGFLIRATDKLTDNNGNPIQSEIDKLPLASEAIGRNSKGRVSIGVGSRKEAGTIETVVKKENDKVIIPASNSLPGVGYSNTFVVFPLSKGKTAYAQAFPIPAKQLKRDSDAAKIVGAFANQITKYLEAIAKNPSNYQLFRELQDFIFEALNYKNSTTPLFHMDNCEKVNNVGDDRGTHIGNNDRRGHRRDLRIFCNPGKVHKIQIDGETIEINNTNIANITNKVKRFLGDTLQFNISSNYIASDNNTRNQVEGLATRDKDGKFVVKIGDESWTFDSYNDFILNNDLVRVNTKPNEYGNNVTRTSSNPNIRYKFVTSSPVERSRSEQGATPNIAAQATQIMSSDRTDKAAQLARLIFDGDIVTTLSTYDLLPHNLVFDSNFNTGSGRETINASFNRKTKVTTIGPRFLAMLSNPNEAYRKQAIRKLIHERLHDILHSNGNEHYIQDIRSIFEQFKQYNKDNNASEKYTKYEYNNKATEEERLEEFLVDSLTSVELADYLNSVTCLSKVNMRERKRDTLLNRIMRLLAKIMGVRIKNDSLYAQEFEALRKAMDSTPEITAKAEEIQEIEQEETPQEEVVTTTPEETVTPKAEVENKKALDILNEDDDEYDSSTTEEIEDNLLYQKQLLTKQTRALWTVKESVDDLGSVNNIRRTLINNGVDGDIADAIIKAVEKEPRLGKYRPLTVYRILRQAQENGLQKDYNTYIQQPVDKRLEELLINYLKPFNVNVLEDDVVEKYGVIGLYDILNKAIHLSKDRNSITLTEEFAHAFVELMGAKTSGRKENADYTFLYNTIDTTSLYKQVYDQYKDIYTKKDESGNTVPDIAKIKKEAIGQALATAINNNWNNKVKQEERSFWQKLKDWFNNILNYFASVDNKVNTFLGTVNEDGYIEVEDLLNKIANEVINNNRERLKKVDDKKYKLLDYAETIKQQTEKDGGLALDFMQWYTSIGNIITGSLAYRRQGTVYRSSVDALHDIDMIVPKDTHKIDLNNKDLVDLLNNRNTQNQAIRILLETPYFKKVIAQYPDLELTAAYPDGKGGIIINSIWSKNKDIKDKFNSLSGSYADRLKHFTEEERDQIYLFDFFIKPHNSDESFIEDNTNIRLSKSYVSFKSKLAFGRAKNIYDYQMWKLYDEFVTNAMSDEEYLMYQRKEQESEYEQVASIADYIQSYSPEDRAEVAKEINNGELSIKCN